MREKIERVRKSQAAACVDDLALTPDDPELAVEIQALRAEVRARPGSCEARLSLARALVQNGAFLPAERELRSCIELAADRITLAGVFFNLGMCREQSGDVTGAARAYEQSAFLCPRLYWARLHLGRAYAELGEHERAVRELEAAVTLDEDCPDARFALGEALRGWGCLRDARAAFLEAARLRPTHVATWRALQHLDTCVH